MVGEPRHPEHLLYAKPCAGQFTGAGSSLPLRLGASSSDFTGGGATDVLERPNNAPKFTPALSGVQGLDSGLLVLTAADLLKTSGLQIWPLWAKMRVPTTG